MPFKKGPAAWRRSVDYLSSGSLVFRDKVKVCSVNYTEQGAESDGLRRFVFWHLAQIQYKNPKVQCLQLKNIVPTPFITFYTQDPQEDDGRVQSLLVNCYKRSDQEILAYCRELVGKSDREIEQAARINKAEFGPAPCLRHCICVVEGQCACPRYKPLPEFMRGKYRAQKKDELEEIRKSKPDEAALKEYWETK